MSTFLYRLGRGAFRHRRAVLLGWLVVLAISIGGAVGLGAPTSDAFRIPGTPAQEANDLLRERFPQANTAGASARVVFGAPEGERLTDPANQEQVNQVVAQLRAAPAVVNVVNPFEGQAVSPTGAVAFAQVTYGVPTAELTEADRSALIEVVEAGQVEGLTVEVGGDAIQAPLETGAGEIVGVAVAAVVLVVTFGSLVAAGMPLLTALFGIGIAVAGIQITAGFIELSSTTPTLALMIGLAVGIDYALFIVSRYRHEIAQGRELEEAAGRAVGTAGSAVVFAGLTVVIALSALSVVRIPFLSQMGLAAAATVVGAVVIALTLLPALLGFAGRRVVARRAKSPQEQDPEDWSGSGPTFGRRWAGMIAKYPRAVLIVAVLGLGVIAIPAPELRLGMPDESTAAPDSSPRQAYDLLSSGFGPGFNGPLTVVVTAAPGAVPTAAAAVAQQIQALPDVATVTPPVPNPGADTAIVTVFPESGPSAVDTEELVRAVRALDGTVDGAGVQVTGLTAINIDISERLSAALLPYLAVVIGLAFLLLLLVFRSILVPLKAAAGFLLTIVATFGAVVAVFQWGWLAGLIGVEQTGPLISFLPILVIGIVFGLAMDYEVFLVSRMAEEHTHGAEPTEAVVSGFAHSARVVTAAALIMISVFAGFVAGPDPLITSIGFALAVAVLFDAFVVRMTIVPAVMVLLGKSAWWLPTWLNRLLPNIDIEGTKLRRVLDGDPVSAGSVGSAQVPKDEQDVTV